MHRLVPSLQVLDDAGIETLLLYGGAFAMQYDPKYVLEYGGGCGILVRPSRASLAFRQLAALDWKLAPAIPDSRLDAYVSAR